MVRVRWIHQFPAMNLLHIVCLENIVKVISKDAAKLALSFRSNPADINVMHVNNDILNVTNSSQAVKPILETLKQACVTLADNSEHVRGFGISFILQFFSYLV